MRITRWIILPLLLLAGGVLIISNIVLQTRTVRGWLESKLESRSGLDWSVTSLSWTPWTGIQVSEASAAFPGTREQGIEPVYTAKLLDVRPYWGKLWEGEFALREVCLRRGRVALPIEFLGFVPRDTQRVESPVAEGAGKTPRRPATANPPSGATAPRTGQRPSPPASPPGAPDGQSPATPGGETGTPQPKAEAPRRPPPGLPLTLRLKDCTVSLYSVTGKGQRRLKLEGVAAELPWSGEDAEGWLALKRVSMGGKLLAGPLRTRLQWARPFLVLPSTTFKWAGMEFVANGRVRARGTPLCSAEVAVRPGSLEATPVPGWPWLEVSAAHVAMRARFRGDLLNMRSWRGGALMELREVQIRQEERGEVVRFEQGYVTAAMQRGVMRVSDARLISEPLSFLGNGMVLPDGRVLGVLRVVADREHAEKITKVAVGSFIAGGWTRSWLDPLVTPDRHYRDIHLRGTVGEATVDVGKKGEALELNQAWERMVAFVKEEVRETKEGVLPSQPRERFRAPQ